jgi:hypothetical protein
LVALGWEHWNRWRDEQDRAAAQARLIVDTSSTDASGGALAIKITNYSEAPILGLELDEVTHGALFSVPVEWRLLSTIRGARTIQEVLAPDATFETYVEFVDEKGERQEISAGDSFATRFSFYDHLGLEWSRLSNSQPRRVRPRRRDRGST